VSTLPNVKATIVVIGSSPTPNVAGFGGSALFPVLEQFVEGIVNGPFLDAMHDAGYAVGRGHADGAQILVVPGAVPGATVTDAQVQDLLRTNIQNRALPQPDLNRLYVVFLATDVIFTATDGTKSFSSATNLSGWNNGFGLGNALIRYAVLPTPGGNNVSANGEPGPDALTESLSHEIAEAVAGQQIADDTERVHVRLSNGLAVQEVGQPANFSQPIPVPGATPLPQIFVPDFAVIAIAGNGFRPPNVTIKLGGTVEWFNEDTQPHTVHLISATPGRPDSETASIAPGQSVEVGFSASHAYFAADRPAWKGTVRVQA
jgi:hypothetical protein